MLTNGSQPNHVKRPAKYAGLRRGPGDIRHTPTRRIIKHQASKPKPSLKPIHLASPGLDYHHAQFAVSHAKYSGANTHYEIPIHMLSDAMKPSGLRRMLYVFATAVLVVSLVASIQSFMTNTKAAEQIETLGATIQVDDTEGVSQGTGDTPSEESIPEQSIAAYQVSNPEHPRFIRIPELGVFARIKNTGLDNSGAVDAPWNIHDVSWFNQSAKPGDSRGASLLLGHVSGWSGPGVFKEVSKLNTGSRFSIEKGNGETIEYEVIKGEEIPLDQVDMAAVLSTESYNEHDLKLMTCSGSYNRETETFESRYVVYAKRVN